MSRVAVFVVLPCYSHYNSCFGLAGRLESLGEQVYFTGTAQFRSHVTDEGFKFLEMDYLQEYGKLTISQAVRIGIACRISFSYVFRRYRRIAKLIFETLSNIRRLKPDAIYLDEHLSHYFPIFSTYTGNIFVLNTKLPTRYISGIAPIYSRMVCQDNAFYRLLCLTVWARRWIVERFNDVLNKLIYNGQSENDILLVFARKRKVEVQYCAVNSLYKTVKHCTVLILAPRALEYDWYKGIESESFLFIPYRRRLLPSGNIYSNLVQEIVQRRRSIDHKIIYLSMGSLASTNVGQEIRILNKIITSLEQDDGITLIVASSNYQLLTCANRKSTLLFEWLPQQSLLDYCDLMISHGGMNSICECIQANVPMLIHPFNRKSDQPGNSARVIYRGLGLRLNLLRASKSSLRQVIYRLITEDRFRDNLRKFREMADL